MGGGSHHYFGDAEWGHQSFGKCWESQTICEILGTCTEFSWGDSLFFSYFTDSNSWLFVVLGSETPIYLLTGGEGTVVIVVYVGLLVEVVWPVDNVEHQEDAGEDGTTQAVNAAGMEEVGSGRRHGLTIGILL